MKTRITKTLTSAALAACMLLTLASPRAALAQDTPGTVKFPTALDTQDSLIRAANSAKTTLSAGLSNSATTITVTSTSTFPTSGAAMVDNEIFFYNAKTSTTFTGVTRGADSTSAAAHSSGAVVRGVITAAHINTHAQAIVAVETKVGSGASTPALNKVFIGAGPGSSEWGTLSNSHLPSSINIAGTLTAGNLVGNGAGITGLTGATGGVANTGSTTVGADTDANAVGVIDLQIGLVTKARLNNNGSLEALSGLKVTGSAVDFTGATYAETHSSAPILHNGTTRPYIIGHGNAGELVALRVGHYFETSSVPGGQFGLISQIRAAGVEGTGDTPPLYGNFKVAFSALAENTSGIATDAILIPMTAVGQVNPTDGVSARPVLIVAEVDLNNRHSHATAAEWPSKQTTGLQIISGGLYRAHAAINIDATNTSNQWELGVRIGELGQRQAAVSLGNFTLSIADGAGHGVIGRQYGDFIWAQRSTDSTPANHFLRYTRSDGASDLFQVNSAGTVIGIGANSQFTSYKDATPTKAAAFGTNVPGTAAGDDFVISSYSSTGVTGWRERIRGKNQTNVFEFDAGAFKLSYGAGAPVGACTTGLYFNTSNGKLYVCESLAWVLK